MYIIRIILWTGILLETRSGILRGADRPVTSYMARFGYGWW